jgi:hypothetical protein
MRFADWGGLRVARALRIAPVQVPSTLRRNRSGSLQYKVMQLPLNAVRVTGPNTPRVAFSR